MKEYLKMAKHFSGNVTTDHNGNICDDDSFFGSTDIAEDYYGHICHAINSHDELVAEVKKLRSELADAWFMVDEIKLSLDRRSRQAEYWESIAKE